MKLGLTLGYWMAQPPTDALEKMLEAEKLGFDTVFTAESWGSDAFTPLAWYGSQTSRIRLGTSIVQISARTPTSVAMHTLTLDHLCGGRVVLGLGVSGPQVVEGWYGQPFGKPLARTREYVSVVRQVLRREAPVSNDGPHYPLPFTGNNALGLGKPLKSIVHPLRADVPIWLGAEGPKNIAMTAEIADGWLPIYYSPKVADMYNGWLDEGFARPGARHARDSFEIATNCSVVVTDDIEGTLDGMKPTLGFYIGGMGAKDMNFHKEVFSRMGYESEANEIQDLFFAGERDKAIAAVPAQMAADISLVGPAAKIRDDLAMWEDAGVTMLVIGARDVAEMRNVAEVILGLTVIRAAAANDVDAMAAVWLDSALTAYADIFPADAPKPTHESLAAALAGDATGFVAEVDGDVVGIVQAHDGWLSHLYVLPSQWGRGIGRALHDAALGAIGGSGQLWVLERNPRARAMYERWGWTLTDRTRPVYAPGGVIDVHYVKENHS